MFRSCSIPCSTCKPIGHGGYSDYGTREQDYHINIIIIGIYNGYVTPNAYVLIYAREACFLYRVKGDGLMLEKRIEAKLRRDVQNLGGLALKLISPGYAGVPDRIVLLPPGKLVFVELKAPGRKLRPLQQRRKTQLEGLGFKVYVIDSLQAVDEFMGEVVR